MLRVGRLGSQETILCEVCQGEFQSPYLLQMHKLCHFNTANTCYVCDKVFPGMKALLAHIASIHRVLLPIPLQNIDDKDILHCEICMQCFATKQGLHMHREHHSYEENKYDCRICGLHFEDCHVFVVHLNRAGHHEMKLKVQNGFVCVDCRAVFGNRDGYAMHMMMRAQHEGCANTAHNDHRLKETTEVQIPNGIGVSEVSEGEQVPNHEKNKSADVSPRTDPGSIFTCYECHKAFGNRDTLAMHVLLHTRKEPVTEQRCNSAPLVNHFDIPVSRLNSQSLPMIHASFTSSVLAPFELAAKSPIPSGDATLIGSSDSDKSANAVSYSNNVPLNLNRRKRKISYPVSTGSLRNAKRINDSDIEDTWSDYGNNIGKPNEIEITNNNDSEGSKLNNNVLKGMKTPVRIKQEPLDFSEQQSSDSNAVNQCTQEHNGPSRSSSSVSALNLSSQPISYQNLKEQGKSDILEDPYLARLFNLHEMSNHSSMEVINFLHQNSNSLYMCKFCKIVFVDRTLYHLHMGLHNLNNPWQCNLCGKICENTIAFTSHVIHYE